MARQISTINSEILNAISNNSNLTSLNSTSQVAIYRLWAYIVATSIGLEEQIYDQFKSEIESLQLKLAPGTRPWIQAQAFKFQYSTTVPQIIQLNTTTFVPEYPFTIPSYQIITNCSVTQGTLNSVNIKVAKGYSSTTPPSPLTTLELTAFQYYMNLIKPAGIIYNCVSVDADRLRTAVTVYYQGIYSSTIAASLQDAYNKYLSSIPFDGVVVLVDLLIKLRAVIGVTDVYINSCQIRTYAAGYGGGVDMVSGNRYYFPEYSTVAGYIVDEDEPSNSFTDLLTLISV